MRASSFRPSEARAGIQLAVLGHGFLIGIHGMRFGNDEHESNSVTFSFVT